MYIIVIEVQPGKFEHFGIFNSLGKAVKWVRDNNLGHNNWYPEEVKSADKFISDNQDPTLQEI